MTIRLIGFIALALAFFLVLPYPSEAARGKRIGPNGPVNTTPIPGQNGPPNANGAPADEVDDDADEVDDVDDADEGPDDDADEANSGGAGGGSGSVSALSAESKTCIASVRSEASVVRAQLKSACAGQSRKNPSPECQQALADKRALERSVRDSIKACINGGANGGVQAPADPNAPL